MAFLTPDLASLAFFMVLDLSEAQISSTLCFPIVLPPALLFQMACAEGLRGCEGKGLDDPPGSSSLPLLSENPEHNQFANQTTPLVPLLGDSRDFFCFQLVPEAKQCFAGATSGVP